VRDPHVRAHLRLAALDLQPLHLQRVRVGRLGRRLGRATARGVQLLREGGRRLFGCLEQLLGSFLCCVCT
jgi:hypothetical protein